MLGVPALFSIGYGNIGSSIYYGLGVVAMVALGATPIALGIAGIIYIFNALTYAEGSAMIPEGGGSASYARIGFNDLAGFISGWALMLSYIVTMAISAYTVPPYLAYFWPALKEPVASPALSMGIIVFLMAVNVLGVRESAKLNIVFIVLDIITQVALIIAGTLLLLIPHPAVLLQNMFGAGNWPSTGNLIFGITLAALCFTGVESVAQQGEETRQPEKKMPQAYILMTVAVLVLFAGISLTALTAMSPQALGDPVTGWARDPVAGIANGISQVILPEELAEQISSQVEMVIVLTWVFAGIRDALPVLVAVLAATILVVATNAGLLGMSRLTYNLAWQRQIPAVMGHVHHRFRTPYIAIILFCLITLLLLVPGFFSTVFFSDLGALYVFGSLLTFALAHASIISLRVRRPDLPRPFKLGPNIKVRGREWPVTAILGLGSTSVIWLVMVIIQPYSRWVGLIWMMAGFGLYYLYRRRSGMPLPGGGGKPVEPR